MPPWTPPSRDAVTVVLVRHGQTPWNAQRRFLGSTDVPLDARGRAEARALGTWLSRPFDGVYTSPLRRARETAQHLDPDPEVVPGLEELCQGELEGLAGPAALDRFPSFFRDFRLDPTEVCVPGGESLGACRDRARRMLDRIARLHRPGTVVAVVTHQMVIASVACSIHGEPLARWRAHGVRNVAMTVLARRGRDWDVLAEDWRFDDPRDPAGQLAPPV